MDIRVPKTLPGRRPFGLYMITCRERNFKLLFGQTYETV